MKETPGLDEHVGCDTQYIEVCSRSPSLRTPWLRAGLVMVLMQWLTIVPALSHTTILISFDGFRHDYLERIPSGAIARIALSGCKARALVPVNPTKTFPNHWTLATGLYPQHHGIVDNKFYDANEQDTFSMPRTEPVWWQGEPIWSTAERAGLTAFTFFWPGSNVAIDGKHPSRWFDYNGRREYDNRMDTVIAWATMPKPPNLIVSYFEMVDDAGHRYGASSKQVDSALMVADLLVQRLLDSLAAHHRESDVNVVIVSDHGMSDVVEAPDSLGILSTQLLDNAENAIVLRSGTSMLVYYANANDAGSSALRITDACGLQATCYDGSRMDSSWHINYPGRIPTLYVLAKNGYLLQYGKHTANKMLGGNHGFHNSNAEMHGIFVAGGPDIRRGIVEALSTTDVYNIVCALLRIEPSANDGDASRVADVVSP